MNTKATARRILTIIVGSLCLILASAPVAHAQSPQDITKLIGIDQKLGNPVPKDAVFKDETGKSIQFGDLLGKRPLVVVPVFYQCGSACVAVTDNLMKTLLAGTKGNILRVSRDFDVVFVSIDPRETPDLAIRKKNTLVGGYGQPGTEGGWHLLTGELSQVRRLTDALGFRYTYDEASGRINHPTGIMFLTPNGLVSSYIVGIQFPTQIMLDDVARAAKNEIGPKSESFLFGCIMQDPVTGKRSLVIENVVRMFGAITLVILVAAILKMSLGARHRSASQGAR